MTLVADASSLILLIKSNVINDLLKENKIMIPEKVYQEVMMGKERSRHDAFLTERLVEEKKIEIINPNEKTKEQVKNLFGLSGGELDAMSLALEKKKAIITDDKKCLNASKAVEVEFMTTPQVIAILFKKNKLTKQRALQALTSLEEFGWYKKDIIKFYKEMIK